MIVRLYLIGCALAVVFTALVSGCSNTRTIIGVDGYGQNYTEIREQRFLMKSTGKNNSAAKEGDDFFVEYKSDSEAGDSALLQAVATGVAIGLKGAAAPGTIPYQ